MLSHWPASRASVDGVQGCEIFALAQGHVQRGQHARHAVFQQRPGGRGGTVLKENVAARVRVNVDQPRPYQRALDVEARGAPRHARLPHGAEIGDFAIADPKKGVRAIMVFHHQGGMGNERLHGCTHLCPPGRILLVVFYCILRSRRTAVSARS